MGLQHDRGRRVLTAKLGHQRQHLGQAHAGGQRPVIGALDGGAISRRVGERDTQLDDVRTTRHQRAQHRQRLFGLGKTGRDIGNQCGATLPRLLGKNRGNARRTGMPRRGCLRVRCIHARWNDMRADERKRRLERVPSRWKAPRIMPLRPSSGPRAGPRYACPCRPGPTGRPE